MKPNFFKVIPGIFVLIVVLVVCALFFGLRVVQPGQVGIKVTNGKVTGQVANGLNFIWPIIEDVKIFSIQTQKEEVDAAAASKDLQTVGATVALNYRLEAKNLQDLYNDQGVDYKNRTIDPRLQGAIKTITAQYTAEELITKRSEVKKAMLDELKSNIESKYFVIEDLNITNLDFSPEYNRAIEAKQVAQQNAEKAKADLERIRVEAQQEIEKAKGQAEAQRLQQSTLTNELLTKLFIEKWNGVMPLVYGRDGNIIDLKSLK